LYQSNAAFVDLCYLWSFCPRDCRHPCELRWKLQGATL